MVKTPAKCTIALRSAVFFGCERAFCRRIFSAKSSIQYPGGRVKILIHFEMSGLFFIAQYSCLQT